jgi:uncharacterized protein YecT (DUF1311 family)
MKKTLYAILITLILSSCSDRKDYRGQLEQLDKEHQNCLDKGERMMDCSYQYSKQMDSMLNVVYKDLMSTYDTEHKNKLRTEERIWIQKRDKELKRIYNTINKLRETEDLVPQDDMMIAYDEKAELIRKRVIELIDKYEGK